MIWLLTTTVIVLWLAALVEFLIALHAPSATAPVPIRIRARHRS